MTANRNTAGADTQLGHRSSMSFKISEQTCHLSKHSTNPRAKQRAMVVVQHSVLNHAEMAVILSH